MNQSKISSNNGNKDDEEKKKLDQLFWGEGQPSSSPRDTEQKMP